MHANSIKSAEREIRRIGSLETRVEKGSSFAWLASRNEELHSVPTVDEVGRRLVIDQDQYGYRYLCAKMAVRLFCNLIFCLLFLLDYVPLAIPIPI